MGYPERNKIQMGLTENFVDIQIEATSPEMAKRFYEMIESAILAMVKTDLEHDWRRQNNKGE